MQRIVVATDRSETAERAVQWAADLAQRYGSELVLVQVLVPDPDRDGDDDAAVVAETVNLEGVLVDLERIAQDAAGAKGRARVLIHDDPSTAVVMVADEERADAIVVGNAGMSGNKKFLLSNIPNRITHTARCTVITVNTAMAEARRGRGAPPPLTLDAEEAEEQPLLTGRAARIARVAAKHGIEELFARRRSGDRDDEDDEAALRESARRLRTALEELGPTFCKLGQILSTRPDLIPPAFVEELAGLRDAVPPLSESEVVAVMEEELKVPWEDVFDSIDPQPLATGSIAQVHRATLSTGERVVVKVQRPGAREEIMRDLGLLEVFATKSARRPGLRQIVDPAAVVEHLSTSLKSELDFRKEASNVQRMREMLEAYPRLGVPEVYTDFSTSRLLVMQEVQGGPIDTAPEGEARKDAARQLIESYYRQILSEGFFHADPHPGNLKWWDDKVWFLDFGMIGELGTEMRDGLVLMLMAFWQEDEEFLAETLLMLGGDKPRPDLDLPRFQAEVGALITRYRHLPLRELQLGPMLQDVSTLAIRFDVPLPATMILTAKALAQIQHATAELDPDLDPFAVAGRFIARSTLERVRGSISPQQLLYSGQKLRVRLGRLVEAFERLAGARPGANLQVQFRGMEGVEGTVRRAARRLALAMVAGSLFVATAMTANSSKVDGWLPPVFGAIASILTIALLVDIVRRPRSPAD